MQLTRRQFATTLAGAPMLAARKPLNIGIGTYSYHSLSMEKMIVELRALKIREIEMSRGEFMLLSHPKAEIFKNARILLDSAQIRCSSYYAATIHNTSEIDASIEFAKLLGATNITGDADASLFGEIDARVTKAQLTFSLHNHYFPQKFDYESPEDLLKTIASHSKTIGITADLGHFASCGYDTVDAIRKLAPRLRLVHLKDVKAAKGEDNVIVGRGIARVPEVMAELRKMRFAGLVAIEYEKEGAVENDMREAVEYARKLA